MVAKAFLVCEPYDRTFEPAVSLHPPEIYCEIVYAESRGKAIAASDLHVSGWDFIELRAKRLPELDGER